MDKKAALLRLKLLKNELTRQQVKTIYGQIASGNIDGAMRGLDTILTRKKENDFIHN